ncbi:MAG: flagellar basal body P-ring formation chaperone FlgA [Pseudomonadota bacterium]
MHRLARTIGIALLALALPAPAAEDEIEPIENIRQAAGDFIEQALTIGPEDEVEIDVGRLDNRLRLARCASPLEAEFPPGGRREGNTAVKVQCNAPVTWSLYVPVTVERYADVVVAGRSLGRQKTIGADDLRLKRIQTSRHAGSYFEDPQEVIGQQTRRHIRAGQILGTQHVTEREVVARGQRVTIQAENGSVSIRMRGEALEGGIVGERIRVRNGSSGRVVEGVVQPAGQVRVSL